MAEERALAACGGQARCLLPGDRIIPSGSICARLFRKLLYHRDSTGFLLNRRLVRETRAAAGFA